MGKSKIDNQIRGSNIICTWPGLTLEFFSDVDYTGSVSVFALKSCSQLTYR